MPSFDDLPDPPTFCASTEPCASEIGGCDVSSLSSMGIVSSIPPSSSAASPSAIGSSPSPVSGLALASDRVLACS
jgi:hypothetical protein